MSTLDYQNPQPPVTDPIVARLRMQEVEKAGSGSVLLAIGAVVTFVSLFFAAAFVWTILWRLFGETYLSFWGWFCVLVLLLLPYLITLERRTRGNFWSDSIMNSGLDYGNPSSVGDYYHQRGAATIFFYVEMLLIGPRMLIGGYNRFRGVDPVRFNQLIERSATLIRDLASAGGSCAVEKLVHPGEPVVNVLRIVERLDKQEWVGRSTDGRRVWLSSRAKADLMKWKIAGPFA